MRLGDCIHPIDVRNRDMISDKPMGINIDKFFMPSVANVVGTDLSNYKVVEKNQFACNLMHVGRDERLPIAILEQEAPIIVSPAYYVFEIKPGILLMPSFLMLWFKRPEFDRNAWFYTDADVRGGLDRDSFLDMEIPVPNIDEQRRIVAEYQAVEKRIATNEALIAKLEETAKAIYKKMFLNDVDPENLPFGWHWGSITEIARLKVGGDKPKVFSDEKTNECSVPVYANGIDDEGIFGYTDRASVTGRCVTITARGTIGCCFFRKTPFVPIVRLIVVQPLKECYDYYLFHNLAFANLQGDGSVQSQLTVPQLQMIKILIPSEDSVAEFHCKVEPLDEHVDLLKKENSKMREVLELFLSKMS